MLEILKPTIAEQNTHRRNRFISNGSIKDKLILTLRRAVCPEKNRRQRFTFRRSRTRQADGG